MWHSLLLGKWNELFYWLPIEELIRSRQQYYYDSLGKSDREADSYAFVEVILEIILTTLEETVLVGEMQGGLWEYLIHLKRTRNQVGKSL